MEASSSRDDHDGYHVSCTSSCSLRLLQIVANLKQCMQQQQQEDGKEDENDCCTEDTSESSRVY